MRTSLGGWCAALAISAGGCGSASTAEGGAPVDAAARDLAVADLESTGDMTMAMGPKLLSQTGLYADFPARSLAPGIIRYVPRYPLWSDGADKERYLLLPPGTKIDTGDMDNWVFPIGTRVWKEFRAGGKLVETRLIEKKWEGVNGWWKVAYLFRADGSDADAVPDGASNVLGTAHDVPSQDDCWKCHASVRDVVIGVSALQLSDPAAPKGKSALALFAASGALTNPPAMEFSPPGEGPVKDALGYLHGNCGHCHNPRSWFAKDSQLKMRLRVTDAAPADTDTYQTSIGIKMFHHVPPDIDIGVVPGHPEKSQLYARASLRDDWAMPPVCTKVADGAGLSTLAAWITALPP